MGFNFSKRMLLEPLVGIEPTTDGLQNRCSTAELKWLMIFSSYKVSKIL